MTQEGGLELRVRLEGLSELPLSVYVAASAEYGEHAGPRWARFTFGIALVVRLLRLAEVVRAERLEAARQPRDLECWSSIAEEDPRDPMRIESGSIEVTGSGFRFLARIRHVGTRVCTREVRLEDLLRAAEGPTQSETPSYERRGAVVVYAEERDRKGFVAELQEAGEQLWVED
jgi:hypothetical protein